LEKSPASYGSLFDNVGDSGMVDQEAGLFQFEESHYPATAVVAGRGSASLC
jgi:hypothetical protein